MGEIEQPQQFPIPQDFANFEDVTNGEQSANQAINGE